MIELLREYVDIVRSFNRDILLYLVSGALVGFASSTGIYNLLLNIYLLRLGHDVKFIGVVNATGAGTYAALCLAAGAMGKKWGPRAMIVLGLVAIAVGNTMLPFAEFVPRDWQATWILCSRLPRAFGFSLTIVNAGPFLTAITTRADRTHVFSVQAALWPMAGFAGSLVGGVLPGVFASLMGTTLESPSPYRYLLFLAALMIVPAVLAVAATRPTAGMVEESPSEANMPFPLRQVAMVAVSGFCMAMTMAVQQTFFNVYMDDFLGESTVLIGGLAATAMLVSGISALTAPFLVASKGQRSVIFGTALLGAFAVVPVIVFRNWMAAGFTYILVQSLSAIRFPTLTVFHQEMVAPRWRSAMSAVSSMAIGCCFMLTGALGGLMIAAVGYPSLFATAALLNISGSVLFAWFFRSGRSEPLNRNLQGGSVKRYGLDRESAQQ